MLQERHLHQAAQVARGLAVPGGQERLHELPGHARPHGAAAEADDVHVVVLGGVPDHRLLCAGEGASLAVPWSLTCWTPRRCSGWLRPASRCTLRLIA